MWLLTRHRLPLQRPVLRRMSEASPVLAIPEGWILDHGAHDRLLRQLARTAPGCSAVIAEWGELLAGSSHRVCAERRALVPEQEVHPWPDRWVRGAAAIRPGVAFEVGHDFVKVEGGSLLVDPGTMAHDPWRPVDVLEDASPLGRPLQDRPVVLFLGFDADPYLADWVRALVNDLVRRGVEGRIAVPRPTGGLHLTKPCAPTRTSADALAPEVIVALDEPAAERSAAWQRGRRFGLVRLTPDTTAVVTVGSEPAGGWPGRVDATIGRGITPDTMAELVQHPTRRLAT
jgi:hypothetical protein